jgi:glycerol dehydrogenase-like iron-containing ADH family enzyme
MKNLTLYPRYRELTRRETGGPRVVTASPRVLARGLRTLARETGGRVWVVADRNTAAAAPEVIDALEGRSGATILAGTPPVVPEIEIAQAIARESAEAGSRAMVVVGSGSLTDLAKYAARLNGVELISVPTAASVDAYTSARSALRIEGYHRTPDARVPSAILASPDIVEAAPDSLTLAGLGDLVAKLYARLDWELASLVTGEAFSRREADWSARAARHALARLRHGGLEEAALPALDALLVTGRTMRIFGSSRSAASSEHTIAHLWEVAAGDVHYHGLLVTLASRYVLEAYRWILERLAAPARADQPWPRQAEADWQSRVPDDMAPFLGKMREESAGRTVDDASVSERRARIDRHRGVIVELVRRTLDDVGRALATLNDAGIERHLPEIAPHWVQRGLEWVKYLRNRYSMFDLAFEMGWEEELLEHMTARLRAESAR